MRRRYNFRVYFPECAGSASVIAPSFKRIRNLMKGLALMKEPFWSAQALLALLKQSFSTPE
jgi:hypothetical protein